VTSELDGINDALGDIARARFQALNVPPGPHSYRVGAVRADGRCDLRAVKDGPPPEIPNVDHWTGSGAASKPQEGSLVIVAFLDGDPNAPMIGAYQPLRVAGGKPVEATLDATTIKVGPTATLIELGGAGAAALALAAAVAANFNTLKTAIGAAATVPGDGGSSFKAALVTALASFPSAVATTKVKGV
jgi:hypothetical protein